MLALNCLKHLLISQDAQQNEYAQYNKHCMPLFSVNLLNNYKNEQKSDTIDLIKSTKKLILKKENNLTQTKMHIIETTNRYTIGN